MKKALRAQKLAHQRVLSCKLLKAQTFKVNGECKGMLCSAKPILLWPTYISSNRNF